MKVLTPDAYLLFLSRFVRLFAYGSLSVVLVFYLIGLGLREAQVGILLTLTLVGDTAISLYLTTRADRMGRRRMLIVGSVLMAAAGLAVACTRNFVFLLIAGTIGVISPSGNEVGPFLSIEQAALADVVSEQSRTDVFAWYTLAGSVATAMGALFAGAITGVLQKTTVAPVAAYRVVVVLYAVLGVFLAALFLRLSPAVEVHSSRDESALPTTLKRFFGIGQSHSVVVKLSSLFALDSFAGGFVVQSFAAYWFYLRFGVYPTALGVIFFWANIFAGISALLSARLAARWGLVNTMVLTHLIPKPKGGTRPLGIATVEDRVVQTAMKLVLEPIFEADFHNCSYGYRPQRNAQKACKAIRKDLYQRAWGVVEIDFRSYFTTIPHAKLMILIKQRVVDGGMLRLIKQSLTVGIAYQGKVEPTKVGVPQGSPISPLYSNIYLNLLDQVWHKRGYPEKLGASLHRYADDAILVCRRRGTQALQAFEAIAKRMDLTVNRDKTRITKLTEGFDFIGRTV
jgi:MFS family permease